MSTTREEFHDEIIEAAETWLGDWFTEFRVEDLDTESDEPLEWNARLVAVDYVDRKFSWPMCLRSRAEDYPYTGKGFALSIDIEDAGTLDASECGFYQYLASDQIHKSLMLEKRVSALEERLNRIATLSHEKGSPQWLREEVGKWEGKK